MDFVRNTERIQRYIPHGLFEKRFFEEDDDNADDNDEDCRRIAIACERGKQKRQISHKQDWEHELPSHL